jgi:myosin-1
MLCDETWPHWHNDQKEGLQLIFDSQDIGKDEYTFGRTKAFIRNPQTVSSYGLSLSLGNGGYY